MMNNSQKITIIKETNPNNAMKIHEIGQQLLITSKLYQDLEKEQLEILSNQGYVIGNHSVKNIKDWIKQKNNSIYVVNISKDGVDDIVGFALVLGEESIVNEVQGYSKDIHFSDETVKDLINSGRFVYLIQIAIKKGFQNQKLGTRLFQALCSNSKSPIISFVMQKPMQNHPSLKTHQKVGFKKFGIYVGDYDNFPSYESIGLIYKPS